MISVVPNLEELIEVVGPSVGKHNPDGLAEAVNMRWSSGQLGPLLRHPLIRVRCVACYVLGLVGDRSDMAGLVEALGDAAPEVNNQADQALWSVWFRLGSADAQGHFKRGLLAMERDQPMVAIAHFQMAQGADPDFAESYHQCAIAQGMLDQWKLSEENCRRTLELLPNHFGALAGLGHCRAQLGDLDEAAKCYRAALRVNPEMDTVAETLFYIESHAV